MIQYLIKHIKNFARTAAAVSMWPFLSCKRKSIVVAGAIVSTAASFTKILAPAALGQAIQMVASDPNHNNDQCTVLGISFTRDLFYTYVGLEYATHYLEIFAKRITCSTDRAIPIQLQHKLINKIHHIDYLLFEKHINDILNYHMGADNYCSI